jgi:hypothetical protein
MVNMRAGLPRLGTVCNEYRLGDLKLFEPKTMCPLIAVRDRVSTLAGRGRGGWRPQGMAAPAGQENDHPWDSQACWTLRRPNAPAYTSLPVALSRSLSA